MTAQAEIDDVVYKWKAFGAIGLFFVATVLSFAMVFLALPAMADDFGVTLRAASWVVIAHTLTISALLLPMGRLADLIGRRRIHLLGVGVFGAGALLVALSPTFGTLIAARVVMAVGDAMTQSVGTGILVSVFPKHERGKAIGSQTTAVAVGAAVGPIFTGLVLQVLPWRALFALLVVPVIVAFVAGVFFLDEERLSAGDGPRQRFDRLGVLLSIPAVVLLVVVINNPLDLSWGSPLTLLLMVVIVGLFTAFIRWELRFEAPMFELRFFKNRVFALGVAARFSGFVGSTSIYFLMPIFVISFRQMSEGRAGVVLFLNSIGLGVAAQAAGRLSDRFGTRPFMLAGFATMGTTSLIFSTMDEQTRFWVIALTGLVNGIGVGSWNPPTNATIIGTVSSASYGVVGAFTNLIRNIGNVFGQAAIAAIVTWVMVGQGFDVPLGEIGDSVGSRLAFVDGWRAAYLLAAGASFVSFALALVIRPPREPRP